MLFPDSFLDAQRLIGDPAADKVVGFFFEKGEAPLLRELLGQLKSNRDLKNIPDHFPGLLGEYFSNQSHLPHWCNPEWLQESADFFQKNTFQILSMLGFYSLPYCYAAAKGAKVLYFSEQIHKNTYQRLQETALFVMDVMDLEAFTNPDKKGLVSCAKVRLMHAAARYYILKSGRWNADWGYPVNQEDMAGTNLSFSLLILRGMLKSGITVSEKEKTAYLHSWNVVASLLGLHESMITQAYKEAFWLEKRIHERHFIASEEGKMLTKALIQTLKAQTSESNIPAMMIPVYMRFLLGEEVADILDIPKSPANRLVNISLKTIHILRQMISEIQETNRPQGDKAKRGDFVLPELSFNIPLKLGV